MEDLRLKPVVADTATAEEKLPHHRVRGQAVYLLYANADDEVRLRLRHRAVGRHPGKAMPVRAVSPTGQEFEQAAVALGEEAEYTFTADTTGLEDCQVVLRGVPGLLGLGPETLLSPAR